MKNVHTHTRTGMCLNDSSFPSRFALREEGKAKQNRGKAKQDHGGIERDPLPLISIRRPTFQLLFPSSSPGDGRTPSGAIVHTVSSLCETGEEC